MKPIKKDVRTTTTEYKQDNIDPVTGEPGAHPVGTGVGAAVGGTAGVAAGIAAGAAYGSVSGPVGATVGAVVGGVVGGLTGKAIAEEINPTLEETYWSETYTTRPYIESGSSFDTYRPAYRHGIDSFSKYPNRSFDEIEPQLSRDWEAVDSDLDWETARGPSRDAYERLANRNKA